MKQNTLKQLLFSPQGRINRQKYILGFICTTIAFYIAEFICGFTYGFISPFESLQSNLLIFLEVFMFYAIPAIYIYISIILIIKRFHDINKSGWYSILFITIIAIDIAKEFFKDFGYSYPQLIENVITPTFILFLLIIGILSFWYTIILIIRKGTEGENRFGQDPLAARDYLNSSK